VPVSSTLALVGFVGLCLLVGAVDGSITTQAAHRWYLTLTKPPGTPPDLAFAPIWSVLYVMMGTAAWLVWKRRGASRPLRLWGWQLAANALWAPTFFGMHSPPLAMVLIVVMLILIALTIRAFWPTRRLAGWLMLPYFGWCSFAAYLNAGFWLLNPA
jgi:translocator protein